MTSSKPTRPTAEERFWAKVNKTETCWLWTGARTSDGYGHFGVDGRVRVASRVAYEWFVGLIPVGLEIDHLCRNRACVNPAHLEAVTRAENWRRRRFKSLERTHCKHGHEFTPENTTWLARGGRVCRTCGRAAYRRWKERTKDEGRPARIAGRVNEARTGSGEAVVAAR